MNTELKLVVINNNIPKHILWIVQMGASYRTFDDENEARIHAEVCGGSVTSQLPFDRLSARL